MILNDGITTIEGIDFKGIEKTNVTMEIRNSDGTVLWEDLGSNASLISGVQDYIKGLWNIQSSDLVQLDILDSNFTNLPSPTYTSDRRVIFGFGVATDGAYGGMIDVVKRHEVGYDAKNLIAFKTMSSGSDDVVANHEKYAFRVESSGDIMYMIKKITPEYKVVTARSKRVLTGNVNKNYNGSEDIRAWIKLSLKITNGELLQWFGKKHGSTDNAFFNSIILFAGRPCNVNINGQNITTYRDVVATNRINFKNTDVMDREISFIYNIYFV